MKNNNAWKEFFRPTKGKVILSVIFLLLSLGAFYILMSINVYIPEGSKDPFLSNPIFWILLLPILSIIVLNSSSINGWIAVFLIILLQLFYIYTLSSLIIWVVNKLRGNK